MNLPKCHHGYGHAMAVLHLAFQSISVAGIYLSAGELGTQFHVHRWSWSVALVALQCDWGIINIQGKAEF